MEQKVLGDKNQFPTEKVIYSHIGRFKTLWQSIFNYIHISHPDFNEQWRYYNDGKSWLLKVSRKSKTIFWLSLIRNSFRMTFYFTDKAEDAIKKSSISDELKDQFQKGKRHGKIRGITIIFGNKKDIEQAKSLIAIKLSVK